MRISRLRPVEEDGRVVIVVDKLEAPDPPPPLLRYCVLRIAIAHRHAIVKNWDYLRLRCHLWAHLNRREPLFCHALSKSRYSANSDLDFIPAVCTCPTPSQARPCPFATVGPDCVN